MPRIGAYYAIHYGEEYLEHSIRSIYGAVHMIGIFYTDLPSHGHRDTPYKNPDTREGVRAAIRRAGDPEGKVFVQKGAWAHEFQHRDWAAQYMKKRGAELILVVDSDEIWEPGILPKILDAAWHMEAMLFRVNFLHFWRSFNWVCRDQMMPVRILKAMWGPEDYIHMRSPVYHFGYAQRPEMVRYKASIHGHRSEWRDQWFEEKFLAFTCTDLNPYSESKNGWVGDVHPTAKDLWFPEPCDKGMLPALMRSHPYWNVELIT